MEYLTLQTQMDSLSTDVLDQLLERFDRMEGHHCRLDRIMERLDTVQNILESQTHKQNLLDERLAVMTSKFEEEKMFMKEQLQGAQNEILERLRDIRGQDNDRENIKTSLAEIRSVKDLVRGQTNAELKWLNNQIGLVLRELFQQKKETKEEIIRSNEEAVEKVIKQLDKQQMELAGTVIKQLDKQQGELAGTVIKQLDKQQMELAGTVIKQLDKQQGELGGAVTKQLDKQQDDINRILSEKVNISTENWEKQIQTIQDYLTKVERDYLPVTDLSREMQTSVENVLTEMRELHLENSYRNSILEAGGEQCKNTSPLVINSVSNNVTAETEIHTQFMTEDQKGESQSTGDNSEQNKVELENISMLISSLARRSRTVIQNVAGVRKKIEHMEAFMSEEHTTVKDNMKKYTTDFTDYIYKTKHELFSVIEKEAQIVRDRMEGPLPSRRQYTCYFYVEHFKALVRSGKSFDSPPWHINQIKTCVSGRSVLRADGDMHIYLLYGRNPREVGLTPMSGTRLKSSATICDIYNKKLPSLDVGEVTWNINEASIICNGGYGYKLGVVSCDQLTQNGYGEKEGYENGAVLIRFDVTVL